MMTEPSTTEIREHYEQIIKDIGELQRYGFVSYTEISDLNDGNYVMYDELQALLDKHNDRRQDNE